MASETMNGGIRTSAAESTLVPVDAGETTPLILPLNESALGSLRKPPLHRRLVASITEIVMLFVLGCNWYFVFNHTISLFTFHPAFMALFSMLATSAILALHQATSNFSRRDLFAVHWRMQVIALICIIIGFTVIAVNKVNHGANHFKSLHGKIGLVTFVLATIQGLSGLSRRFWLWSALGLHYQRVVALHRLLGYATISCTMAAIFTALDNNWAIENWSPAELRSVVKACVIVAGVILILHGQWSRICRLVLHKEPLIV